MLLSVTEKRKAGKVMGRVRPTVNGEVWERFMEEGPPQQKREGREQGSCINEYSEGAI